MRLAGEASLARRIGRPWIRPATSKRCLVASNVTTTLCFNECPSQWASVRACLRGFLRPPLGNGPRAHVTRQAIATARRVAAFAPYAEIFPRKRGQPEVRAYAPGRTGQRFQGRVLQPA